MDPIDIFQFEDICFENSKYLRVIEIWGLIHVPRWQFKIPNGWFKKQVVRRLAKRGHPATLLDSITEYGSIDICLGVHSDLLEFMGICVFIYKFPFMKEIVLPFIFRHR
jgi:hypothetical protein